MGDVAAKRKLTPEEKKTILELAGKGKSIIEIARALNVNGQSVNGFISTAQKHGVLPSSTVTKVKTAEERAAFLRRAIRDQPAASFSFPDSAGQLVTISAFDGGITIKIAKKATAVLTTHEAARFGVKMGELANWVTV